MHINRCSCANLTEKSNVKVVVIVGDDHFTGRIYADAYGVVGHADATDVSEEGALVVEDDDSVSPVVADENFFLVVDCNSVRKVDLLLDDEAVQD